MPRGPKFRSPEEVADELLNKAATMGYFVQRDDLVAIFNAWLDDYQANPEEFEPIDEADVTYGSSAADQFIAIFERLFPVG